MRRVKETVHYYCNDTLFGHIDGSKVTTAVLDTGVSRHPDLDGKIVAFGDMLHGKRQMYDDNSHGTHVSGIIAGPAECLPDCMRVLPPDPALWQSKCWIRKGKGKSAI